MTPTDSAEVAARVLDTLLSHAGQVVQERDLLPLMPALNRPKAVMQLKEIVRSLKQDGEPIKHLGSGYVYLLPGEAEPAPVFSADFVSTMKERRAAQGDLFGVMP